MVVLQGVQFLRTWAGGARCLGLRLRSASMRGSPNGQKGWHRAAAVTQAAASEVQAAPAVLDEVRGGHADWMSDRAARRQTGRWGKDPRPSRRRLECRDEVRYGGRARGGEGRRSGPGPPLAISRP